MRKAKKRSRSVLILMRKDSKPMQTRIIRMQKGVLLWLMVLRHTPKGMEHRRPAIIPTRKAKKRWQVVYIRTQRAIVQKQKTVILTQKEIQRRQMVLILTQKGVLLWLMVMRHTPKGMKQRRPANGRTQKAISVFPRE